MGSLMKATLRRDGKNWPVYIGGSSWRHIPIDDIFPDDELQMPSRSGGSLVMRVVLSYGRVFRDANAETIDRPRKAHYEIQLDSRCPSCAHTGAHSVTVKSQDTTYCPITWPVHRTCRDCGNQWQETAKFPEMLFEEMLA